jgi:hypothetical protein
MEAILTGLGTAILLVCTVGWLTWTAARDRAGASDLIVEGERRGYGDRRCTPPSSRH